MKKVRLFDRVDYAVVDYTIASEEIVSKAAMNISYCVFAMPVHGLVLAVTNSRMRYAAEQADMIVPDGQPIRWLMNYFYGTQLKDRVYGPTLVLHVLKKANESSLNVFLYGGSTEETLNRFAHFIGTNYPKVNICGRYREHSPDQETLLPGAINASQAHLVLVGRGCPKQEFWISKNSGKVHAVMMGVGAAFSFHAGMIPQAPEWMQNNGLEWLFRLIQEPRRLFTRYLLTNITFMIFFLKQFFEMKILNKKVV